MGCAVVRATSSDQTRKHHHSPRDEGNEPAAAAAGTTGSGVKQLGKSVPFLPGDPASRQLASGTPEGGEHVVTSATSWWRGTSVFPKTESDRVTHPTTIGTHPLQPPPNSLPGETTATAMSQTDNPTRHIVSNDERNEETNDTSDVESCWRLEVETKFGQRHRPPTFNGKNDSRLPAIATNEIRTPPDATARYSPPLRLPSLVPPQRTTQQHHRVLRRHASDSSTDDVVRPSPPLPHIDEERRCRLRREAMRKSQSCNDSWLTSTDVATEERTTPLPSITEADAACEMADSVTTQPRQRAPPLLSRPTTLMLPHGDVRRNFRRHFQGSPPASSIQPMTRDRSPLTPRNSRLSALRLPVILEDTVTDGIVSRPSRHVLRRAGPAFDRGDDVDVPIDDRAANGAALAEAAAVLGAKLFVDEVTDRLLGGGDGVSAHRSSCSGLRRTLVTFDASSPLLVSFVPDRCGWSQSESSNRLSPLVTNASVHKRNED